MWDFFNMLLCILNLQDRDLVKGIPKLIWSGILCPLGAQLINISLVLCIQELSYRCTSYGGAGILFMQG